MGHNINEKGVFITMYGTVYSSMYGTMSDNKKKKGKICLKKKE